MSYGVIIYGDLTLASRSVNAWRKTKLDATDLAKGDLAMSKEIVFIKDDKAIVETILARLPNAPLEFVHVEAKDGALTVRASIDEDAYRDIGPEIAALAVAAGAVGGRGVLYVTSQEENFLVTVAVDGARVKATRVHGYKNPKGFKAVQAARQSAGYLDVLAKIAKGLIELRGPLPPPRAATKLDDANAALHRECIARLERVPKAALMKIAKGDFIVALRPGMPTIPSARGASAPLAAFPTKEALLAYLAEPFVLCARAALTLCAEIDPDVAESLAIRYASSPIDDDLVDGIARGLASRESDASLDATLELLEHVRTSKDRFKFSRCVRMALATSRNDGAGERALALLKKCGASHGADALVFAVGQLRCTAAKPLLKTLAKNVALRREAMIALQTITKDAKATGFHYGPSGGLIANKRRPTRAKRN